MASTHETLASTVLFAFATLTSDPHRLPRDSLTGSELGKATKKLNREAYALRTFITLIVLKVLGSMGLINFEKCLRTALEPAAPHPNQRQRRAAAAAGAGVG